MIRKLIALFMAVTILLMTGCTTEFVRVFFADIVSRCEYQKAVIV